MHQALPTRAIPTTFARAAARQASHQRRRRLQLCGCALLAIVVLYFGVGTLFSGSGDDRSYHDGSGGGGDGAIPKDADVVIVTLFDQATMGQEYMNMVKMNRDDYAARHGYRTFYTDVSTYAQSTADSPSSWALIPAVRNALSLHPFSSSSSSSSTSDYSYIWSLTPHALIMNPSLSLHSHIFSRLDELMLKDIPVVPPDSVIHTFSHLRPSQAHLIISQDMDNVAHSSFLLRNTANLPSVPSTGRNVGAKPQAQPRDNWAHFLLDAWFDPLYRQYSFQKAEQHALEHIVQWHPTILAKLVVVQQRVLNSYNFKTTRAVDVPGTGGGRDGEKGKMEVTFNSTWEPGDLVIHFHGCAETKERDCRSEMRAAYGHWQVEVDKLGGVKSDEVRSGVSGGDTILGWREGPDGGLASQSQSKGESKGELNVEPAVTREAESGDQAWPPKLGVDKIILDQPKPRLPGR